MKIVILAGGSGKRLWPLSRQKRPKQFVPIIGNKSLIQIAVQRVLFGFNKEDIFVVLNKKFLKEAQKQLPELSLKNFIIEPEARGTTTAIGLAVYNIYKNNPKEIIVTMASDHYIENPFKFIKALKKLNTIIKNYPNSICLFGIKPTYPETGYGYIEKSKKLRLKNISFFKVKRFIEKPKLSLAKKIYNSSNFFWNGSYFAFRVDTMVNLFENYIPETHRALLEVIYGKSKYFKFIKEEPIEHSIIEKLKDNIFVLPVDFKWADIGHWASIKEIQAKKGNENVVFGLHHFINTKNCLLYNYTDKLLTTIGIKDVLIVQVNDGVLICHKNYAQDVKKLVEEIQQKSHLKKFL